MKVTGLVHIGICISDMEKSIDFYTRIMGFKVLEGPTPPIHDNDDSKGMGLEDCITRTCIVGNNEGNIALELVQFIEPDVTPLIDCLNHIGKHHIAYEVDDIFAFLRRWEDEGMEIYYKPVLVKTDDEKDSFYWAYVKDPDGITLELSQPLIKKPIMT